MDAQTTVGHSSPELFQAQPGFSDAVNGNIIRSEIEGGVYLRQRLQRPRHPHLFAGSTERDATTPVEPVRARKQAPLSPQGSPVEFRGLRIRELP